MQRITQLPAIPQWSPNSHKGDFGRVLVLAGSAGFMGAAFLTTMACMRSGAGLVTLGVPLSLWPIASVKLTCAMTKGFAETFQQTFHVDAVESVLDFARNIDVIALGPGISQNPSTCEFVQKLIITWPKVLVLDADGLNCISQHIDCLKKRPGPTVITPHPGEFSRLCHKNVEEIHQKRQELASEFAQNYNCYVVLKFARTIVTNGIDYFINTTGNVGLATGGSGDILTGVITGLLARNFSLWNACQLGVWAHGRAADIVANELGEMGMMAEDILPILPKVWRELYVEKETF